MNFTQPLWLVAFRPLFALGCLAGAILPLTWMLLYTGVLTPWPAWDITPLIWHAHEMFFGFGGAILAGFLLTASKNWVAIRGYHGGALAALAAAWLLDRLAIAGNGLWPPLLFWPASSLFVIAFVSMVLITLIRYHSQDSYRADNRYFVLALPLLLPAKWLLLQPAHFYEGSSMVLAIFRLCFIIMLERTLTQFINSAFARTLARRPIREHAIKSLATILIAAPWLAPGLNATCCFLCALLLLWRWLESYPLRTLRRLDIGIMLLGQLAIIAQLFLAGLLAVDPASALGGARVHLFTVGALGLIIPAMVVRISKGHTGRKVQFDALDKLVLWLMIAGLLLRIVPPLIAPASYVLWLWLTAACWVLGFGTLSVRYIPWLLAPRVDVRAH